MSGDTPINPFKFLSEGDESRAAARRVEQAISARTGILRESARSTLNWLLGNMVSLPEGRWVFYSRDRSYYAVEVPWAGKGTGRYGKYRSYSNVVKIVNALVKAGFADHDIGVFEEKRRSRLKPTSKLRDLLNSKGAATAQIDNPEVIELRGKKKGKRPAKRRDYKDNGRTNAMRSKVKAMNETNGRHIWTLSVNKKAMAHRAMTLTQHPFQRYAALSLPISQIFSDFFSPASLKTDDLGLLENCHGVLSGFENFVHLENGHLSLGLDPSCHRVFNENFGLGGRFYGSDIQRLPNKTLKLRRYVTIDGGPTVELDYGSMHPSMLYNLEGLAAPSDPYDFSGSGGLRPYLKLLVLIILNAKGKKRALAAFAKALLDSGQALPTGVHATALAKAFEQEHRAISHRFYSGCGLMLQNLDARIAEAVMTSFVKNGLPISGIHDSFVVRECDEGLLRTTMFDAYRKVMFGFAPVIK